VLGSYYPNVAMDMFNVNMGGKDRNKEFSRALQRLVHRVQRGEHYDAINMSLATEATLEQVNRVVQAYSQQAGVPFDHEITLSNFRQHKQEIIDACGAFWPRLRLGEKIKNLEYLINQGNPVFAASVDTSADRIPLEAALVDGIRLVKATTVLGEDAVYSGCGNVSARGDYALRKVSGDMQTDEPKGWSIRGDDQPDILNSPQLRVYYSDLQRTDQTEFHALEETEFMKGCSYATPKAIADYFYSLIPT
jgi:hypothetical protein